MKLQALQVWRSQVSGASGLSVGARSGIRGVQNWGPEVGGRCGMLSHAVSSSACITINVKLVCFAYQVTS
jgi:hypothetical protein